MDEIKVYVIKFKDRDNYVMKYTDPMTGKNVRRSTGTNKLKAAEKIAAKWEAELQEGRYRKKNRLPWDEFCEQFETDGTGGLKARTIDGYLESLDAFQRLCRPRGVFDLTTAKITAFARELRKPQKRKIGKGKNQREEIVKLAEASVARHLRHLKRVSRWAHRQGFIHSVPQFDMPKKSSGAQRMKGRPITLEEFERMLAAVPKALFPEPKKQPKNQPTAEEQQNIARQRQPVIDSWKLLLRGLWASGLRLSEALALRWDQQPGGVSVMLNGRKSVLAFDADSQKSGKVQLVPLAPEAVELLEPLQQRQGFVFEPRRLDGLPMARHMLKVSKIISRIGKAANVVVDPVKGKSASAHDLRRAFGYRWSRLIMPTELKELMRHASIETTMTYYVGQNAEATAEGLWDALGHKLGHIQEVDESERQKTPGK
jgi:integrase